MLFLYFSLFSVGVVVLDQFTKYLTVANIDLYEKLSFIPGILRLTHVRNTGAAFSMFSGMQWLFALVFLFFTGLLLF